MSVPRMTTNFVVNKTIVDRKRIHMCVVCYGAENGTYKLTAKGIKHPLCRFCVKCESFERIEEASATFTADPVTKWVKQGERVTAYFD